MADLSANYCRAMPTGTALRASVACAQSRSKRADRHRAAPTHEVLELPERQSAIHFNAGQGEGVEERGPTTSPAVPSQ